MRSVVVPARAAAEKPGNTLSPVPQGEDPMLTRFSDFNDWPSFGFADFGRSYTPHARLRREL